MDNLTPEERRARERLEMVGRLDVAEHKLERVREVLRELRSDPQATLINFWRAVGRLEAIVGLDAEDS